MRRVLRMQALGAAAVVVAWVGTASPAGAAETLKTALVTQQVTFTYEGEQITCEFFGASQVEYNSDTDESSVSGQSGFASGSSDPPECKEATESVYVDIRYRNESGDIERLGGFAFGEYVSTGGSEEGEVTEVVATHRVVYACGSQTCSASVTTNPK
jgi:hypothetical protein